MAENLYLPLGYRDIPRAERAARVADMLDRFGGRAPSRPTMQFGLFRLARIDVKLMV